MSLPFPARKGLIFGQLNNQEIQGIGEHQS